MGKQNTSAFKRVLALALTLMMMVGMLPMNVIALEADDRATVALLEGVVAADDGNGNFTVTEATLNWSAATAEHGEGWWVGIRVTAPASATAEDLALASYTADGVTQPFGTQSEIHLWVEVTAEYLAAGNPVTHTYEFNWNGQGDNNQTVTLTVDPSGNIVLNPKESEPEPETVTLTVSKTGNGTVKVNGSDVADTTVTVQKDTPVKIEVIPATGSRISSLIVGGVQKTIEGSSYTEEVTFTGDSAIQATFVSVYTVRAFTNESNGGTVKFNNQTGSLTVDAGTNVSVVVEAANGYRIQSVKIDGVDKGVSGVSNYTDSISVTQDTDVEVVFVKVYTVSVTYNENGLVFAGGEEISSMGSITVVKGTEYPVLVATPADNYRVAAVAVDGTETTFDRHAYEHTIELTKDQDHTVVVTFAQSVYTVEIGETQNGTVNCDEGTVNHGDSVTVTVEADPGYEVTSVTANGSTLTADEDGKYTISDIKENQTITATFARKKYNVNIIGAENGTVEATLSPVEHGSSTEIIITPAEGYTVGEVLVNRERIDDLNVLNDDQFGFTINNVVSEQNIEVTFIGSGNAASESLTISGEKVRELEVDNSHTFVYKYVAGSSIIFETDKEGIRLRLNDGRKLGGRDQKSIVINESIESNESIVVERIELYYKGENDARAHWHQVQTQEGKPLKVVFDNTSPVVDLKLPEPNENGYYGSDFGVEIIACDGIGAGIQSVKYSVIKDADTEQPVQTQSGTLYEYSDGGDILNSLESLSPEGKNFTVEAANNNGDNIKIVVEVTDRAGKTATYTKVVNISVTSATITFTDTPYKTAEDANGIIGYYNKPREAKITITDDPDKFNPDGVELVLVATDLTNKKLVENADTTYTIDEWKREDNQYVATVTFKFENDVAYIFDTLNYTNKVGIGLNSPATAEGPTPCLFTVDTTPPYASVTIDKTWWAEWLEWLTFGLYKNDNYTIKVSGSDKVSPIEIQYCITDNTEYLSQKDLEGLEFVTADLSDEKNLVFNVEAEGPCVVYLKVTDYAGNVTYVHSDGVILDTSIEEDKFTLSHPNMESGQPDQPNQPYGADGGETIPVTVAVKDTVSGIQRVEYWIVKDNIEGDHVPLYSFAEENPNADNPAYDDLEWEFEDTIEVKKADYNSSNVVVHVKVTDNAGNEKEKTVDLDIDITPPEIHIEFDTNDPQGVFFGGERKATITITEREGHLTDEAVENAIRVAVQIRDKEGNGLITVDNTADLKYYTIESERIPADTSDETPDEDKCIVTVTFKEDAIYAFEVSEIKDLAGNVSEITWADDTYAAGKFGIDRTPPKGTVIWTTEDGTENSSSEMKANTLSYYDGKVRVTFKEDESDIRGIYYIQYYLSDSNNVLSETDLQGVTWGEKIGSTEFDGWFLLLEPDQRVTVYLKLVDSANRVSYISTNGMILDDTEPSVDDPAPDPAPNITITPEGTKKHGIYTGDVKVNISVTDPLGKAPDGTDGSYSGLKDVAVTITDLNGSAIARNGDLEIEWIKENGTWKGSFAVDSQTFNSNDVKVEVTAVDNAGNDATKSILLAIDTTAPVVSVTYKDYGTATGNFYNGKREATITVEERNFISENIAVEVNGTGVEIDDWTKTGTGDETEYSAVITFDKDGEYTLEVVSCEDDAGNKGNAVDPTSFIIDMSAPDITVTYTNNDVQNDRYFKEARTVRIEIEEQNFNENLVEITQTAAQGGESPNVGWTHNGDTHVATLTYSVDGVYTFDITAKDEAGNVSGEATFNGVAGKDFVIDTTYEDMVTIGGVANGKAYGYGETPIPTVQIEDINLDEYDIKLTGIQKGKTIDLTDQVYALLNAGNQEVSGTFDIFQVVQDLDGIYTLSVYGLDKAGNEDSEEVTFTVNRFGSVYVYDDYLQGLISNGGAHTPAVSDDIVITEYNAVNLLPGSLVIEITCDGKPLENVIYEVTPEINDSVAVGESGWYQYRYTISKDNFTSDGVYKVTVSSKDAAGNVPENNNYDGMAITFRVDSTAPEITSVVGLEEAIVNATELTVKYDVYDTMGIKSIKVYVDDALVDEITDFTADLNNYSGSFSIGEKNTVQHVRIVVEDLSGNVTDTDSEYFVSAYEFHKDVTVSTNIFVRWYANKGLFWGSIIGAGVLVFLIIFLIAKRKKKEER